MPKKFTGENSKVTAAKERKAAAQAEKESKARAQKEAKESAEWAVGTKRNKREDEEAKKAERAAKKAEAAALLAKEEAAAARKAATSAASSKSLAPRVSGAAKVAARREQAIESASSQLAEPTPEYSASGLDAALELLDFTGIGDASSSASSAKAAKEVDRHPERRAKAAWLAFKERELDAAKKENPGLRLSQLNEILWKRWQKSPENPFNMTTVAYNATADDERQVVEDKRNAALDRMRVQ
ncbi:hypothetical protein BCR44DRAFT_127808 [Catenaria anguillulae PL171]|uniref:HMG box domain-containing protein n=1 Tax=Catenaria anguillulae PL171 TaxID=765915 RepID=A0A1Y2HFZ5_9FUNG|nr:hypothetical protein BCR44DRAFT_127808 [Catenaria anguillulae PL171]